MDKQRKQEFELYVYELFEQLKIDNSEQLYKTMKELEECIVDIIGFYIFDKHLEM